MGRSRRSPPAGFPRCPASCSSWKNSQARSARIPTDAQSISIGQEGTDKYVQADGTLAGTQYIGLTKFSNPGGLDKVGGNYYRESANSGNEVDGTKIDGRPTATGLGSIESGFLEMSNVDLSEEFTDMIVAQRGFQANTRIITTSDQILEELVNLKR